MLDSPSSEEMQFIKAIECYKADNDKLFLSWSEVLKILKGLGYRKHASPKPELKRPRSSAKKRAIK
ncbi:MAG: hypothetical protein O7J95_08090 [Planctomycetota bacterium]|nr:hypothetical protein [Planctomycetota bacterium]